MVDLGSGVYLTTSKIRTFTFLNYFTDQLTPATTPLLRPLGLSFPAGTPLCIQAEQKVVSVCAVLPLADTSLRC